MCPPGYHHNGFVTTHALGLMHLDTSCPSALVATKQLC